MGFRNLQEKLENLFLYGRSALWRFLKLFYREKWARVEGCTVPIRGLVIYCTFVNFIFIDVLKLKLLRLRVENMCDLLKHQNWNLNFSIWYVTLFYWFQSITLKSKGVKSSDFAKFICQLTKKMTKWTVKPHVIEPLRSICHAPKELIIDQDRISFFLPPVFLKNLKIFGPLGASAVTNLRTYCCDRANFQVSNPWMKISYWIVILCKTIS